MLCFSNVAEDTKNVFFISHNYFKSFKSCMWLVVVCLSVKRIKLQSIYLV